MSTVKQPTSLGDGDGDADQDDGLETPFCPKPGNQGPPARDGFVGELETPFTAQVDRVQVGGKSHAGPAIGEYHGQGPGPFKPSVTGGGKSIGAVEVARAQRGAPSVNNTGRRK